MAKSDPQVNCFQRQRQFFVSKRSFLYHGRRVKTFQKVEDLYGCIHLFSESRWLANPIDFHKERQSVPLWIVFRPISSPVCIFNSTISHGGSSFPTILK
jgi:hypothetical protein